MVIIIMKKLLPHINLILLLVALTLFILTRYNPGILSMSFYMVIMYLFFACSFIVTIIAIVQNRRE